MGTISTIIITIIIAALAINIVGLTVDLVIVCAKKFFENPKSETSN